MAINTLFIGRSRIELSAIDSTNSYAVEAIKNGSIVEGAVVWAHEQTNGRGQRGNKWQSEAHQNLTISVVVKPQLEVNKQFYITKIISLAVLETVAELSAFKEAIKIKWPNDIFIDDKKVGGILIENILSGNLVSYSIIGVGLNLNQVHFADNLSRATSLKLQTGIDFDIETCLNKLCEHIEARYLQLKARKYEMISSDYLKHLYRKDELCDYKSNETPLKATLTGVNEEGKLLLKLVNGEVIACNNKEVEFL